jgi:glycosyltransferase involved in cell wall biosynthesis
MTKNKYMVSVILPSAHNFIDIEKSIYALIGQTYTPSEIIIIDSFGLGAYDKKQLQAMCQSKCTLNIISHSERLNPGAARNQGVEAASGDFIAFIDIMTIPRINWLSDYLKLINRRERVDLIWGSTVYDMNNSGLMSYVRDSIYGVNPIRTLPGTIIKKNVFYQVGQFLEDVRTGEDSEWMNRTKYLNIVSIDSGEISADYYGLLRLNFKRLVKKWVLSYRSSGVLEYYKWQRQLAIFIALPYIILIAYNWNWLVADWQVNSLLFIPHITKIVIITPLLTYFFYRGMFLPRNRGLKLYPGILPIRFLMLFFVGAVLDMVKLYAFMTLKKIKN